MLCTAVKVYHMQVFLCPYLWSHPFKYVHLMNLKFVFQAVVSLFFFPPFHFKRTSDSSHRICASFPSPDNRNVNYKVTLSEMFLLWAVGQKRSIWGIYYAEWPHSFQVSSLSEDIFATHTHTQFKTSRLHVRCMYTHRASHVPRRQQATKQREGSYCFCTRALSGAKQSQQTPKIAPSFCMSSSKALQG